MMKAREELNIGVHDTYDMLKCAFPEGVPDESFDAVVSLILPYMSFRQAAHLLSGVTDKHYSWLYNYVSGFPTRRIQPAKTEKVKQKLDACGYAAWVEANTLPSDLP
jgi:hypothetical protein